MVPFLQFVENIDEDKPNHFELLKKKNKIRPEVQNVTQCNSNEKELMIKLQRHYRKNLEKNWQSILTKNIKYKKPAIINLQNEDLQKPERLYVLPIFIKSGK